MLSGLRTGRAYRAAGNVLCQSVGCIISGFSSVRSVAFVGSDRVEILNRVSLNLEKLTVGLALHFYGAACGRF